MFPKKLFYSIVKKYLHKKFTVKTIRDTVAREDIYLCLSFVGKQWTLLKINVLKLVKKLYLQTNPKLYFKKDFKIGSIFQRNISSPLPLRSSVVYKYTCDCCEQSYIVNTKLQRFIRSSQHFGVSHRTGRPLSKPPQSSIRAHSDTHDHRLKLSNFSALMSCHNSNDLRILESIFIHKLKP